jgi:hypothetical protein
MRRFLFAAPAILGACSDSEGILLSLQGTVSDFSEGDPIAGATVALRDESGELLGEGETDDLGRFEVAVAVGYDEEVGIELAGRVEHPDYVASDFWQTVRVAEPENASVSVIPGREVGARVLWLSGIPLAPVSDQPGTVAGTVFDAVTGAGVGGLDLVLREGIHPPEDAPAIAATVTSLSRSGLYVLGNVPPGTYTAYLDGGDEWLDSWFPVVALGGAVADEQNGGTSAVLDEDEFRVTLSWGAEPPDLDAHLTGPPTTAVEGEDDDEENRLHVYFADPDDPPGLGEDADVFLDIDDTASYGPETITCHRMLPGTYRYSVHDFTNGAQTSSAAMSASRARVQLFVGRETYEVFDIVPGREGTNWTVFELDGETGRSYLVNEFKYTSNAGDATAF